MRPLFIIGLFLLVCGCNNRSSTAADVNTAEAEKPASFFPVTAFIKGQLREIGSSITPLKYTTIDGHTDSAWLKSEELGLAFAEFLTPVIDSTNLTGLFTENKFVDRSYNDAITFTYEPRQQLPDTMALKMWTVYIDPEKNTVQKVYLKKEKGNKELQLTWQTGKWASTITIANNPDGTSKVEKEEKIIWDFNNR